MLRRISRRLSLRSAASLLILSGCLFFGPSPAARAQSDLLTWGDNTYGEQGDGLLPLHKTPGPTSPLIGFSAGACGWYHCLALKSDGTVWAWGQNVYGQLGDGTTTGRPTPVQVSGLSGVVAVAGGSYFSYALKPDGTVWAWGLNSSGVNGALGDGTYTDRSTPVQNLATDVVSIAAGGSHGLAVQSNGTVLAWGRGYTGQLGDGTYTDSQPAPVKVSGLTNAIAVAGGRLHSLALKNDGTVWAWGDNSLDELGDGTTTGHNTPVQVKGPGGAGNLTQIVAIAAGDYHNLAVKSDGTVWAWGYNGSGQLGDGTTSSRSAPVQVSGLTNVIAVAGGSAHSLALKNDGTVWAWGYNANWQLGDNTNADQHTPVQVKGTNGVGNLTGVTFLAGSSSHSLAVVPSVYTSVSGTITLSGCVNMAQSIGFTFRPTDNSGDFIKTQTLLASGAFSLSGIPQKAYTVHIQGAKWLAKNVAVNTSSGSVSGVTATLLPGDINGDNTVNITDLGLLADSFGKSNLQVGFNPNADLNGDNTVNILDLGLLADNFGKSGDP
jgi:alpha-tubulin suppressor-like RCC1 family protein